MEQSKGWAEHQIVSVPPVAPQHLSTYPAGGSHVDPPRLGPGLWGTHGMS